MAPSPRLGRAPGGGWTGPSPSRGTGTPPSSRYRHSACRLSCSSVVSAGSAPRRVRPDPARRHRARQLLGIHGGEVGLRAVEVHRRHLRAPRPPSETAHLVEAGGRQLEALRCPAGRRDLSPGGRERGRRRASGARLSREVEGLAHGVPGGRLHVAGGVARRAGGGREGTPAAGRGRSRRCRGWTSTRARAPCRRSWRPARPRRRRTGPARRPSPPAAGSGRSARRRSRRCAGRGTARTPGWP